MSRWSSAARAVAPGMPAAAAAAFLDPAGNVLRVFDQSAAEPE